MENSAVARFVNSEEKFVEKKIKVVGLESDALINMEIFMNVF